MAKYKVDITGVNTSNIKVLKSEETIELFKRYQSGDLQAKEALINGNLKLVLSILKRFNNSKYNLDDLFQVGVIGLIKAIDNFDLSYNLKLSTYACPLIVGEIKRYIRDNNSIRVSRSLKDLAYKSIRLKEDFYNKTGKDLEIEAIAKELDATPFEIVSALDSLKEPISIFEPIYNDGGDTILLYDQIEDKKSNSKELSSRLALEKAIDDLDKRENYILNQRYVIGKTQMEIAKELDISQAQVSRLEKGAIKQLKKTLK